jgi:hypothetical protein
MLGAAAMQRIGAFVPSGLDGLSPTVAAGQRLFGISPAMT